MNDGQGVRMSWNHELHSHPVSHFSDPRMLAVGEFKAEIRAWQVDGSWFPSLLPLYSYDERGAAIDSRIAAMIQGRFDPTTRYSTSAECLDAAQQRFEEAVASTKGI